MKKMIGTAGIMLSMMIFYTLSASAATDTLWTAVDLTGGSTPLWHRISESPMETESYHSGAMSFWCGSEDAPLYAHDLDQALVLNYTFDLSQYTYPRLTFWHYLDMDVDSDDRAMLDISSDGGQTWELAVGDFLPTDTWMEVSVNLAAYVGQTITIRFRFASDAYNINNGYGWFIDDLNLRNIAGLQTIYGNDFDSGTSDDFTHYAVSGTDTWILDNAKASSGEYCFHAVPGVSSWSALQTPAMDFSGSIAPQLSFNHWYEFPFGTAESDWSNGAIVEITTDAGATAAEWTKLYPVGGYPAHCSWPDFGNPLGDMTQTGDADVDGFYGYQRSWEPVQFDLSAYVGEPQVWIRFSTGYDFLGPWTEQQWFVDDVLVTDFANEQTVWTCDMEFIDLTPEEAYADFAAAVDALPVEAFRNYKSVDKAVKRMEKQFAKHPELKTGRLLEIYEWLCRPVHQRALLNRLDRIERKYVARERLEKAAHKLEKQVLKHMDGKGNDWVEDGYREPLYEQGLLVVQMLRDAAAAEAPLAKGAEDLQDVQEPLFTADAELGIAPNPVREQAVVSFTLDHAAHVTLGIYDLSGRLISELTEGTRQAGTHRIGWEAFGVDAGNYLAVLEQNGERTITMVHVIR